ncbi:hypothetical protein J437_LFUL005672 [Ladona fulva]|uniref:SMB domain-containing protein n=1 Tax=Ladona fulva TaxID=123851 RepID=A0A8K0K249_LADFU|nr:hypothetical protein J437_LFUL005672 [Ladona fulva]
MYSPGCMSIALAVLLVAVPPVLLLEDHHHHGHHHQSNSHSDLDGSISASPAAPPPSPVAPRRSSGSCRESRLCCPGRDSSCVVQKAPLNAIIEDLSDEPCYCDHACIKLGDCCSDFKEACGGECLRFYGVVGPILQVSV